MTVAVGQTGYMLAGQELPIQSANIVNNALQTTTSYKPVGVQLYITPQAIERRTGQAAHDLDRVGGHRLLAAADAGRQPPARGCWSTRSSTPARPRRPSRSTTATRSSSAACG